MQPPGGNHVAADAADRLFVLQGGGVALWLSYTTRRTELEPISTIATGARDLAAARGEAAVLRSVATAKIQVRLLGCVFILSARPRPDKEGLVMK
jgi:hypothetical protein